MAARANRTVLVVAAHPDDEVLGCGGAIARHAAEGDAVHVVIVAEGATSRGRGRGAEVKKLAASAGRAQRALGARSLAMLGLPDNRLDSIDRLDLVQAVEAQVARRRPGVVYTHHAGDVNIDHRLIHEAVITACRPQPGHPVKTILAFEVPSSTEWQPGRSAPAFTPDWYVDISGTLPAKLRALRAYAAEMRPWPHPRSLRAVEHLARWRGASAGVAAAEAFMLARHFR